MDGGSPGGSVSVVREDVMSESGRMWDLLQRAYEGGDAWRGPSLRELLEGVTASQAAARPIAGTSTIWELVLHLTLYEDVVRRRIGGEPIGELSDEEAWPTPTETSAAAWRKALSAFEQGHRRLRQALAGFADARLIEVVPGRDYPFYVMLYGAIQHVLYHAAHVEMLMLAQGAQPQGSPLPRRRTTVVA